jgi:SWI/SNF-related matrix-associated actin-dependent regulator 1 of chromatin subfamily A
VSAVELAPARANIELRRDPDGQETLVLSFPYERTLVEMARSIPHRRFDWDSREWSAPVSDWAALKVEEMLEHYPELHATADVEEWLRGVRRRWIGTVTTTRYDGRGWLVLQTLAGPIPEPVAGCVRLTEAGRTLLPLTEEVAHAMRSERSARLDAPAERVLQAIEHGEEPPAARLAFHRGVEGEELRLEVGWDPEIGAAFERLPGAGGTRAVAVDPWVVEQLDAFLALHGVTVTGAAHEVLEELRAAAGDRRGADRRRRRPARR